MKKAKVLLKDKITISERKLKDGRISLFFTYRINGEKRREAPPTKLYLIPEKTALDRNRNEETMRLAKAMRDKRQLDLQYMEAGIEQNAQVKSILFSEYCEMFIKRYSANTRKNYMTSIGYFNDFRPSIFMGEINRSVYCDFMNFLRNRKSRSKGKKLSANSIALVCVHFRHILKSAVKDNYLVKVPDFGDLSQKWQPADRPFLTMDEIRTLMNTPSTNEDVKRAFLFTCFTGLRFCDVRRLHPGMIENGHLVIRQEKTDGLVRIKLSENAMQFLPSDVPCGTKYFNMLSNQRTNACLQQMQKDCGLTKHLTFHVARHTYAMLLLQSTGNVYITKNLLGHRCLSSTESYLHYLDEAGDRAISLVPSL